MKPEEGRAILEKHFCYSAPEEDFYYDCGTMDDPDFYYDDGYLLLGDEVKTDNINFSFLFNWAPPEVKKYGIRVTVYWEVGYKNFRGHSKYRKFSCKCGILELCGNYNYYGDLASDDLHTHVQMVEKAREFFRKYKVMFAAAWSGRYGLSGGGIGTNSTVLERYFCMFCKSRIKADFSRVHPRKYFWTMQTFYTFIKDLLFEKQRHRQFTTRYFLAGKSIKSVLGHPRKYCRLFVDRYFLTGKRKLMVLRSFARAHREGKYSHLPIELQKLAIFEDIVRQHNLFDMHD